VIPSANRAVAPGSTYCCFSSGCPATTSSRVNFGYHAANM
jgi:hypothetical protein